ncbi:hypothetical protein OSB04_025280 [Centaurea solstitialis]|uniref:Uncharacterized protein n=1 Tax=Centaurea solstitialis TaxID=347529 RepID=A0AA38T774_9ASTR|nr:hypothetical protein OSB04_025280 [Centaurea solstitialis]
MTTSSPTNTPTALTVTQLVFYLTDVYSQFSFKLSTDESKYKLWRRIFLDMCKGAKVHGHLTGKSKPAISDDDWETIDSRIKSWFYSTCDANLLQIISDDNCTAKDLWDELDEFFLNNKMSRMLQLQEQFRNTKKGTSSITDFCLNLKNLADALAACDSKIDETELVMQILRQLPPSYHSIVDVITNTKPFPSFLEAKNMLLLHESRNESIKPHPDTPLTSSAAFTAKSPWCASCAFLWGWYSLTTPYDAQHSSVRSVHEQSMPVPLPPQTSFSDYALQYGQTQFTDLSSVFQASSIPVPQDNNFYMDSGATRHMTFNQVIITIFIPSFPLLLRLLLRRPMLPSPLTPGIGDLVIRVLLFSSFLCLASLSLALAERTIRTINNTIRMSLIQASLPPTFWVEALLSSVHTFNLLPSTTIQYKTPFEVLFGFFPTYTHLCVFGCLCYPNTSPTSPHKLAPRSSACVYLRPSTDHRGYRCLDLITQKVIISRHVTFDETHFSFPDFQPRTSSEDYDMFDIDESLPSLSLMVDTSSPAPDVDPSASVSSSQPPPSEPSGTSSSPSVPSAGLSQPPSTPATTSGHPMTTRSRTASLKPKQIFNLSVTTNISPIPRSTAQAINGRLERYKARLVAQGFSQQPGLDFDDTFSPVVKPATIRTVLSISISRNWPIRQLDVKNAFLHGDLIETVYMRQPPGYVNSSFPDHVCRLRKALYGRLQAPRVWYHRFAVYLSSLGFLSSKTDTSLFTYHRGSDTIYLLLYVDDILLTASSPTLISMVISQLSSEFPMSDLGPLSFFLGIAASRSKSGLFLSQSAFAQEILARADMVSCNPCSTPADTKTKLAVDGEPVSDPTLYRSLAGALQYLTFTRPDIAYAVQQVYLFMHDPRLPHLNALKRILRYLKGTLSHGLHITPSAVDRLVAYSDADWAGCPNTRRFTSGFCVYLGDNLVSWSSKRQHVVSRSSAEAEYRGIANAVAEAAWLRNLLLELSCPLSRATVVFCDNVSAMYLASNPVQHQRTKHVEIDLHFVRERVAIGHVRVLHVPSTYQYADIFTKGLPSSLFLDFRNSLNIRVPPDQTTGSRGIPHILTDAGEFLPNTEYDYLLSLASMFYDTSAVKKLEEKNVAIKSELQELSASQPESLWLRDLKRLLKSSMTSAPDNLMAAIVACARIQRVYGIFHHIPKGLNQEIITEQKVIFLFFYHHRPPPPPPSTATTTAISHHRHLRTPPPPPPVNGRRHRRPLPPPLHPATSTTTDVLHKRGGLLVLLSCLGDLKCGDDKNNHPYLNEYDYIRHDPSFPTFKSTPPTAQSYFGYSGMSLEEIVKSLALSTLQFQQETRISLQNLENHISRIDVSLRRLEAQVEENLGLMNKKMLENFLEEEIDTHLITSQDVEKRGEDVNMLEASMVLPLLTTPLFHLIKEEEFVDTRRTFTAFEKPKVDSWKGTRTKCLCKDKAFDCIRWQRTHT